MQKDHSLSARSSASPAESVLDSVVRSAAELKLCEAEQRLNRHRWEIRSVTTDARAVLPTVQGRGVNTILSPPVPQRAAAEGRGHPQTLAPAGAEKKRVSEGGRGQSAQTARAAAGVGEDRRRKQDAA